MIVTTTTLMQILYVVYLLGVPLLVMNQARRWTWINRISPMTILYIIGLLVANTTIFPTNYGNPNINTFAINLAVPIALPLMLLGCNVSRWSTGKAFKVFITGLLAVMITVLAGFFLFRGDSDNESFIKACAVITGQYTGGIPNVAPIAKAIDIDNKTLIYLTSYDLVVTGLYLIFLIFAGKQVFRFLLPYNRNTKEVKIERAEEKVIFPFDRSHWKQSLLAIGMTIIIAGTSAGLAIWIGNGEINMTVLILAITTLSIAASFLKPMKKQESAFDMGLYCVYVFCLSIASACDVRTMNFSESLNILWFEGFVIFGSLVLQVILARLLKIDGDSVMVGSVALINSPPFVPMVAAITGNRDVMMTGISVGILGYMLGNYLGIGIYHLLLLL